jgi:hypothetical protein
LSGGSVIIPAVKNFFLPFYFTATKAILIGLFCAGNINKSMSGEQAVGKSENPHLIPPQSVLYYQYNNISAVLHPATDEIRS